MLLLALPVSAESKFHDPLDTPAEMRSNVTKRPLMALTKAGERIVAVGSRGLIIGSDDHGKTWTQAQVPVQSDLLAVHFPTANEGWAVGHEGVVLHSADGGKTWTKQLDGRMSGKSFKAFYGKSAASAEDSSAMQAHAVQLELNYKAGPALPFLDVWFEDAQKGYVVGSFGMIAATTDGGKSWEPWLHRIDNSLYLNLNVIRVIGSDVFIVGERGLIYRLDRGRERFDKIDTGFIGSFFGITGNSQALIAYGLEGAAYRSGNMGKSWEALGMPSNQTLAAGIPLSDGEGFVLVDAAGQFLLSDKSGKNFRVQRADKPMRMTGIVSVAPRTVLVTGLGGVRSETLRDIAAGH
ncbi:WD40/YVTN/BNR-like repeat-containing protein [Georgfuchsia toluolica]|uniref:WD40/YVTN/BNR-like repeat-containing protein n=1 Tax=Georgfuchsia toluolica TaxID=424218 RepID=UPI001C73AD0A|nr:YCF48-related protein [Georgfuchsia toluolica]